VGALRIAETIRMAIEAAVIPYEKHELRVTISAGLATFPENGRSVQELIAAADAGLYRAKSEGRNRVVSVNALEMAAM
jgi:diguanylate cyclase (GGDEF)-like protein